MLNRYGSSRGGTQWTGITVIALACLLSACSSTPPRSTASSGTPGLRTRGAPINDPSAGLEEISIEAMALVGTPYRYGGNTPDSGFDCSGLVRYVFKQSNDIDLPRTSVEMSRVGEQVDKKDLQPGDLVFFNTLRRTFSHVGIYVGEGRFIHSPRAGGVVRIEDMRQAYWAQRFDGARRADQGLLSEGAAAASAPHAKP